MEGDSEIEILTLKNVRAWHEGRASPDVAAYFDSLVKNPNSVLGQNLLELLLEREQYYANIQRCGYKEMVKKETNWLDPLYPLDAYLSRLADYFLQRQAGIKVDRPRNSGNTQQDELSRD